MTPMTIDCDDCVMQQTATCDECLVTAMCGHPHDVALVIEVAEVRAVRLLGRSGLVPPLRHMARPACA